MILKAQLFYVNLDIVVIHAHLNGLLRIFSLIQT